LSSDTASPIAQPRPGTALKSDIFENCVVCGGVARHRVVFEKWGFPIFRCVDCGLGSVRLTGRLDVAEVYNEAYFHGQRADGYADYVGSENVLRSEFRRAVARLRRYGTAEGRLLEVGCAYGFFLQEAQSHFDCFGIEVCAEAVEFCRSRSLNVDHGETSQRLLDRLGLFDAVVMLDVIEHLENPHEVLQRVSQSVRPAGSLMISTGDWSSMLARLMGRKWRLLTPPQHLFYFSDRTLTTLLARVGFRVIHRSRPWKIVPFSLAAYQVSARMGMSMPSLGFLSRLGVPVNLFDTILIIAVKN
jgi:SAM-dependent methyltransferase